MTTFEMAGEEDESETDKMQKILDNTFCLQHLRLAHALCLDQNKTLTLFDKARYGFSPGVNNLQTVSYGSSRSNCF